MGWSRQTAVGVALVFVGLLGCTKVKDHSNKNEHLLSGTLWFQTSGENRALQLQAFNLAKRILDEDLKDRKKKGKRAVVVDVDETVLDNSRYQAWVIKTGKSYPQGWAKWARKKTAAAIPGSLEFLNYADKNKVDVFYITNRKQNICAPTIENLKKRGFPNVSDKTVLCRTNESGKTARRDAVRKDHRIVVMLGDNLSDFSYLFDKKSVWDRRKSVEELTAKWGTEFVVLPNPMYGDWEAAIVEHNYGRPNPELMRMRYDALTVAHLSDRGKKNNQQKQKKAAPPKKEEKTPEKEAADASPMLPQGKQTAAL